MVAFNSLLNWFKCWPSLYIANLASVKSHDADIIVGGGGGCGASVSHFRSGLHIICMWLKRQKSLIWNDVISSTLIASIAFQKVICLWLASCLFCGCNCTIGVYYVRFVAQHDLDCSLWVVQWQITHTWHRTCIWLTMWFHGVNDLIIWLFRRSVYAFYLVCVSRKYK